MTKRPLRDFISSSKEHWINQMIVKPFWHFASWWGMRKLGSALQQGYPSGYADTITHFDTTQNVVALTIDDGISRGGPATCMALQVRELLQKYRAHATFFVCTDYVRDQEEAVQALLEDGNEVGNHMERDIPFYYSSLSAEEFRKALADTNAILDALDGGRQKDEEVDRIRWFRAPQGILTSTMKQVLDEQPNMKHVLGDCYCDDWKFAQEVDRLGPLVVDDNNSGHDSEDYSEIQRRETMQGVANLMLSQVQRGSIAIFHMPEVGFRQGTLLALEFFLQAVQEKGWKCINLSEMRHLCIREQQEIAHSEEHHNAKNVGKESNLTPYRDTQ